MMDDLTEVEMQANNNYLPGHEKKKKTRFKSFGQKIGSKLGKKFSKSAQKDMLHSAGLNSQIVSFTE